MNVELTRALNFLSLIVIAGIIAVIAIQEPKNGIVSKFFKGFGGTLQTALSGGTNIGKTQ